jgi:low affinity Fe/Cu permease
MGNSVTFIIAVAVVVIFLTQSQLGIKSYHGIIGDIIISVTFLNLFIIQKTTNRFAASLHLKVNELVASNTTAHNSVMNVENKTEQEMTELTKEYSDLTELIV